MAITTAVRSILVAAYIVSIAAGAVAVAPTVDLTARQNTACVPLNPVDTVTARINALLSAPGATGYSLQLCPDTNYPITAPLKFAFPNQQITTQGFPGPDLSHRATITVNGPINPDGSGHTTAVDGTCANCMSVSLRYVQINGNRTPKGAVIGGGNIEFAMQLGGINMVDYDPWKGDYTGTIVENNNILGGFATTAINSTTDKGKNPEDTFIKIGIAMGPRTWFGDKYQMSFNKGGTVRNNLFQGAFGYAMAAATVVNWTVSGNVVDPDVTFIGSVGPNCSRTDATPTPEPFVFNSSQVLQSNMQQNFVDRDADSLTCILPDNDDFWPFVPTTTTGGAGDPTSTSSPAASATDINSSSSPSATGDVGSSSPAPLAIGITFGVIFAALFSYGVRWWYMRNRQPTRIPLY
ncbi:hypothetical protein FRB99_008020 [Tulasnella sp. 403]|nr:hypothetical protein FRB99_008020 [Tulasnella sp. 403]